METQTPNVPALPGLRPGDAFVLKMKPFFLNNWSQLLAIADDDDLMNAKIRHVRVFNGVATLATNHVMLRTPLNMPNGFYEMDRDNRLIFAEECDEDTRFQLPRDLKITENIGREEIHHLMNWVSWCVQREKKTDAVTTIVVDEKGFWYEPDTSESWRIPSREKPGYAVDLPITKEPVFVNAFHLKLALVEALRYDTVVIGYQWDHESIAPLFFGNGPGQCSLVMPRPPVIRSPRTHG